MVELPYGRAPLAFEAGDRTVEVLLAPSLPPPRPLGSLLDEALAAVPCPRLGPCLRVTVILSDATRPEPRAAFLAALERWLP
ncbi:MAG: hypothetical protein ABI678_10065, partial [Kofleriaceae bacterium]